MCATAGIAASCASVRPAPAIPGPAVELEGSPGAPRYVFSMALTRARAASTTGSFWRTLVWIFTGTGRDGDESRDDLVRPFDVATGPNGTLLVADPDLPGVFRFGKDGAPAGELSCKGRQWGAPMSLAVGGDDSVYVADAGAGAIVRWRRDSCDVISLPDDSRPTGVAVTADRIYVADPPNHHLLMFATDGSPAGAVGERGEGEGQFSFPTDVAAAPDGSVYVVDALNFRIVHLAHDGRWLGTFGRRGDEGADLSRPKGLCVDADGSLLVTDASRDVIIAFRGDGTFISTLGGPGVVPGRFAHPSGISSGGGRLLVADSQNRRIQVFEFRGEPR